MSHANVALHERKRLREKKIKKHALANILTHWFNVAMWLLLLPTGIAILASPRLGLSPKIVQEMFRNLFGGTANLITFHYSVGLLWVVVLGYNVLLGFRRYFVPFARTRMLLDKDDVEWMKIKPLQMMGLLKGKPLPPQDAYNAGQKLYAYDVVLATLGIMASGLVMTFHGFFPQWMVQWAQPLHWVSVGAIVAGLMIHVYMGAVFPEEKEAFFSMFTGEVSALYARFHHEKWYEQKVKEELQWEHRVLAETRGFKKPAALASAVPQPAAPQPAAPRPVDQRAEEPAG